MKKRVAHEIYLEGLELGVIKRKANCELCRRFGRKIGGHHYDYHKPLDILSLCTSCHGRMRGNDGKELEKSLLKSRKEEFGYNVEEARKFLKSIKEKPLKVSWIIILEGNMNG